MILSPLRQHLRKDSLPLEATLGEDGSYSKPVKLTQNKLCRSHRTLRYENQASMLRCKIFDMPKA
jgi:hypothetical protein